LTYFFLTVLISWTSSALVVGPGAFPLRWERFERLGLVIYIAAWAGPTLACLLLTGLIDGRAGLRDLVSRVRRWRVVPRWYAIALVLPPAAKAATLAVLSVFSSEYRPAIFTSAHKIETVLLAVAIGLLFGFFEELGWTGFAIPKLRLRHGIVTTGLVVGFVWGAWHFPLFWEKDSFSGALPLTILLVRLFAWLPPFRVLMVWLYDRTGSLLPPMLMHTSLVATQLIFSPGRLTGTTLVVDLLAWCAAVWVALGVIFVANRGAWNTTRG
jgi:membrane protease YdiL (CAAX protease family)